MGLKLSAAEVAEFLTEVFPQVKDDFTIEELEEMRATVRLNVGERHLRPGGTVSGPAIFALADVAIYITILGMIGREALTVTTNCSIDFMRKPAANTDLVAACRLLKLGRSLAVGEVLVFSDGMDQPVARASLTYAIPPAKATRA
ncbi:PaaI family thioesterase [Roseovarius aestuariivivens]|uniref:PaaI family thioesterase n=1 Tax=Roseovarius aestuariivivens TaxID=1888910 RepID=UPI001081718F|nr:PaaI family thioesterase [Roseovarius aestuariivivens]